MTGAKTATPTDPATRQAGIGPEGKPLSARWSR